MKTADAIKHYDGIGKRLAEALGVTPQCVYQWGKNVPRLYALEIEKLTEGKLQAGPIKKNKK